MLKKTMILLLVFAAAFFVRWSGNESRSYLFSDPDSIYHLIRIKDTSQNFPFFKSYDRYSHYPQGNKTHWPAGHTLLYTSIVKLTGGFQGDEETTSRLALIGPVFGSLLTVLATLFLFKVCKRKEGIAIGIILLVYSPELISFSSSNGIDHHIAMQIGIFALFIGLWINSFSLTVFSLFFAFFLTPEAMFYVTAAFPVLYFTRQHFSKKKKTLILFAPAICSITAFSMSYMLDSTRTNFFSLNFLEGGITLFIWFLSLAMVSMLLDSLIKGDPWTLFWKKEHLLKPVLAGLIFITCWVLFLVFTDQTDLFLRLGKVSRLSVAEERSPLSAPSFFFSPVWYKIHLVILMVFIYFSIKAKQYRYIFGSLAFVLVVGLLEYRHFRVYAPLACIGIPLAFSEAIPLFKLKQKGYLGAWVLVLALLFAPMFWHKIKYRTDTSILREEAFLGVTRASKWLKEHSPGIDWSMSGYGVASGWDVGHHIHYFSERPVVMDPLNYPAKIIEPLVDIWGAHSSEDLEEAMQRYRCKYLILIPPQFTLGSVPQELIGSTFSFYGKEMLFKNSAQEFAGFRMFLYKGLSPEFISHFQPKYFDKEIMYVDLQTQQPGEPLAISRHFTPATQVFEFVKGISIQGVLPEPCEQIHIQTSIKLGPESPEQELIYTVHPDEDLRFSFHTSLPAPHQETTFTVNEAYHIETEHYESLVPITQDQVHAGGAVIPKWSLKGE